MHKSYSIYIFSIYDSLFINGGYPMSDNELLIIKSQFPSERFCRAYMEKQRWPGGFVCPRCSSVKVGMHKTRGLYQCKKCRTQISLTAGTMFHKTRLPLKKWFWLILLMSNKKNHVSMLHAQKLLGIRSYRTVWLMMKKIKSGMGAIGAVAK